MSRNRLIAACVAVALALVLAYVLWPSGGGDTEGPEAAQSPEATLAKLREARRQGTVDVTPGALAGRVVDGDGGAVAGATVSVGRKDFRLGARATPGGGSEPMLAVTGADGSFRVAGLEPGTYTLAATARGYAPAALDGLAVAAGEERDDVVVTLERGGHALRGEVTDIGGGPVAGAVVRATSLTDTTSVLDFFRAPYSTRSGDDGRYELPLRDGVYGLQVVQPDYVSVERTTEIRGSDRTEDFVLTPGAVVYGRVLSRGDDAPVAGATVMIQPELSGGGSLQMLGLGGGTAETDADGRFELRGLGSGRVALRAFGPGFASKQPAEVELGIGEQRDGVIIYVERAFTISGFVVDADDPSNALEGVLLGAFNFGGAFHIAGEPSAPDGYFEIHGVQPGSYMVGAAGEGRVPQINGANVTVESADVDDVLVELDRGVTVSGRLEPPRAGQVLVEIDPENISIGNMMQTAGMAFVRGRAGEDGAFTLEAVPPGAMTLVAKADDGGEGRTNVKVADEDVDGVVIRIEDRGRIEGVVVDEHGQPAPGVRVRARHLEPTKGRGFSLDFNMIASGGEGGALTRQDGGFTVVGLASGRHALTVRDDTGQLSWADPEHRSNPREAIEVTIEGANTVRGVRLVVEAKNGEITGVVVGPGGAPVPDAWVTARHASVPNWKRTRGGGGERSVEATPAAEKRDGEGAEVRVDFDARPERPVLTGPDGRFTVKNLRDGTYDLEAESPRGAARGETKGVAVGNDARIELERLAGITGVVTHPRGEPVTSYILEVDGRRRSVANPEGRYTVSRLEPGTYRLGVIAEQGRAGAEVEVETNEVVDKDMEIVAWGSVRGRVVDATTGDPMPDLVVLASTEEGTDWAELAMSLMSDDGGLRTDEDGQFVVGRLGRGPGQLGVVDADVGGFQLVAEARFALEPGQDLDLGEIRGAPVNEVPEDQRGELGMHMITATWADRPSDRSRGSGGGDEGPDDVPEGLHPDTEYLWVSHVDDDGAAADAGVEIGDRITTIAGTPVEAVGASVARQLLSSRRLEVGTPIALGLDRDGSPMSVTVVPRPSSGG